MALKDIPLLRCDMGRLCCLLAGRLLTNAGHEWLPVVGRLAPSLLWLAPSLLWLAPSLLWLATLLR